MIQDNKQRIVLMTLAQGPKNISFLRDLIVHNDFVSKYKEENAMTDLRCLLTWGLVESSGVAEEEVYTITDKGRSWL